jgi:hypothetical protein
MIRIEIDTKVLRGDCQMYEYPFQLKVTVHKKGWNKKRDIQQWITGGHKAEDLIDYIQLLSGVRLDRIPEIGEVIRIKHRTFERIS